MEVSKELPGGSLGGAWGEPGGSLGGQCCHIPLSLKGGGVISTLSEAVIYCVHRREKQPLGCFDSRAYYSPEELVEKNHLNEIVFTVLTAWTHV